jgi:hypothetical protein
LGAYSKDGNGIDEENIMNFNNNQYDAVGVAIVEELFKQAEDIYPISDEPTPPKPSLFKRLIGLVKQETSYSENTSCGDEIPAHSSL